MRSTASGYGGRANFRRQTRLPASQRPATSTAPLYEYMPQCHRLPRSCSGGRAFFRLEVKASQTKHGSVLRWIKRDGGCGSAPRADHQCSASYTTFDALPSCLALLAAFGVVYKTFPEEKLLFRRVKYKRLIAPTTFQFSVCEVHGYSNRVEEGLGVRATLIWATKSSLWEFGLIK